ncbi:MAG TPA: glycosyltransferase family 39 protein [Patescibacteria group bacterium]|nr:glycosyltransferase family 39 protein [Patescibacteria group bacterium]
MKIKGETKIKRPNLLPRLSKYFFFLYLLFIGFLIHSPILNYLRLLVVGLLLISLKDIILDIKFIITKISRNKLLLLKLALNLVQSNTWELIVIVCFVLAMLSVIKWGLPSSTHPFPYFMDESHQLQAVKTVAKYGTSNYPHQENGPMLHYIISGIFITPFILLKIVNPFAIKSAISSPDIQAQIYSILRLEILFFSVLSMIVFILISRKAKINSTISILLFVLNPVWFAVSVYFKYDVPFLFWTLLTFFLLLLYAKENKDEYFILAGLTAGLSLATKITGISLLAIYLVTFVLYSKNVFSKIKVLILGLFAYLLAVTFFGIPDIIFSGRSMSEYLYYNVITNPQTDKTLIFGTSYSLYKIFFMFPAIFGYFTFFLSLIAVMYLIFRFILIIRNGKYKKYPEIFLTLIFLVVFSVSLTPLVIVAANRALILLPFMIISVGLLVKEIYENKKSQLFRTVFAVVLFFVFLMQLLTVVTWIFIKFNPTPQEQASNWMAGNIKKGTLIGIENIPVYEMLPDLVVKEFYNSQYKTHVRYNFQYEIVDYKTKKLPPIVILSNAQFEDKYRTISPKKLLVERMYKEGYREKIGFSPLSKPILVDDISFVMTGMSGVPIRISIFEKGTE